MNGGFSYLDVTGIGTAGGSAKTVAGLWNKLNEAYVSGKIMIISTDGSNADLSSPAIVNAEKSSSSSATISLSWVVAGSSHIYVYRLSVTNADAATFSKTDVTPVS